MNTKTTTTTLAAVLVALLAIAPPALAQSAGGEVPNTAPSIESGLSGDVGSTDNLNAVTETFSFTVKDVNTEDDVLSVSISSTDATFGVKECLKPFDSCAGWTVTDAAPGDGILAFSYAYAWPAGQAAGSYTQTVSVSDEDGAVQGAVTDSTVFANAANVVAAAGAYDDAGAAAGPTFGGWVASAGATNIASPVYVKAFNDGTADGSVSLSFSDVAFTSPSSGGSIDVDGNVLFRYGYGDSPSAATMTDTAVDADGSYTFPMPQGSTLWVTYELQAFPAVLPDASDYGAAYTFG